MIKNTKKILILITLIVIFGINKVHAVSCDDLKVYASSGFGANYISGIKYSYKNYYNNLIDYDYHKYVLKDSGGSSFSSYCRHAGKSTGNKSGEETEYVCEKKVFDTSVNNDTKNRYEAGVLAILENGYSTRNNKTYQNESVEIIATDIALRAYEMLWPDFNNNSAVDGNSCNSSKYILRAQIYFTNLFIGDSGVKSLIKSAVGSVRDKISCERTVEKITYNGTDVTTTVKNRAKQLVTDGLNAAIYYKNNGAASVSTSGPKSNILEKKYEDSVKMYKKTVTYTFDINKFKNATSKVDLVFNCPNCSSAGLNYKFNINGTDVGSGTTYNLLSYVKNGSGKVTVKITFTRNTALNSCQSVNYSLNLKYFDETIDTEAYSVRSKDCTQNACQHFYMLYSTDNEVEKNISDSIEVCDCKELEVLCDNGNAKACNIIDTDYDGKCANCKPVVTNAECTKNDSEIDILEGYEIDDDTCQRSTNENILQCVIGSKDEIGNTYLSNDVNSKYCTVWCKEDYHLKLPGQKEVTNGRYFSLKTNITGTKTCYTSRISKEIFQSDYDEAKSKIRSDYNRWMQDRSQRNASTLDASIKKFNNIVEEYNSCSNWTMSYNYNPDVKFWYEESYMDSVQSNVLETVGSVQKSPVSVQTCTTDVRDDAYKTCSSGWTSTNTMERRQEYLCKKSGSGYVCGTTTVMVSRAMRMKASITATGSYITPTQFYTIYPNGSIAVNKNHNEIENASPLTNKLPVGLGTKSGVYNYTLYIDNLGEYYNSDKLGRIWGNKNSIVKIVLADKTNKCQQTGALVDKFGTNDEGVYVCAYKVNCPDCPVECDKDGCEWKDCPTNSCPVECDNCIFANGDSNIDYRPISPDDINPNDRDLGKNWASDENIDTAMELKAYTTTEEIETYGDTVYDVDYQASGEEFAMEVTLDSKMISKIKEYNKNHKGYLNNSLSCYDYKNSIDNKTYKNVYCYSTFIDELLYDNDLKDNIKISKDRVIGTNPNDTHDLRKQKTQDSGYWTTWSEATSNSWRITTERELYFKSNYGTNNNVGPSWK